MDFSFFLFVRTAVKSQTGTKAEKRMWRSGGENGALGRPAVGAVAEELCRRRGTVYNSGTCHCFLQLVIGEGVEFLREFCKKRLLGLVSHHGRSLMKPYPESLEMLALQS